MEKGREALGRRALFRNYHVLFVLAGVFFFAGFALLDNGVDLRTSFQGEETFAIPAGAQWYYAVEIPLQAGGRIHVEFQETAQQAIAALVLSEGDYQSFLSAAAVPFVIEETTGASGVLALNLRDAGTYYLVFMHGAAAQATLQEVDLQYSFTGVQPKDPDWVLVGLGVVAMGLGALVVTMAARRRIQTVRDRNPEASA